MSQATGLNSSTVFCQMEHGVFHCSVSKVYLTPHTSIEQHNEFYLQTFREEVFAVKHPSVFYHVKLSYTHTPYSLQETSNALLRALTDIRDE